jgi:hypothetical protein
MRFTALVAKPPRAAKCARAVLAIAVIAVGAGPLTPAFAQGRRLTHTTQTILEASFKEMCKAKGDAVLLCESGLTLTDYHRSSILQEVCGDDPTVAGCKKFLEFRVVPRAIRFNAETRRWSGSDTLRNDDPDLEFTGPLRAPFVYLGKGESLTIEVTDINPALYGVELGKATESDIEQLADLKVLLPQVGGTISSFFTAMREFSAVRENDVDLFSTENDTARTAVAKMFGFEPADANAALAALHSLQKQIVDLQARVDAVQAGVERHEPKVLAVMGVTQSLERAPTPFPRQVLPVATSEEWRQLFAELREKYAGLKDGPLQCESVLDAFSKVVDTDGVEKLQPALSAYDAVPRGLCSVAIPPLATALDGLVDPLRPLTQDVKQATIELARLKAIAEVSRKPAIPMLRRRQKRSWDFIVSSLPRRWRGWPRSRRLCAERRQTI